MMKSMECLDNQQPRPVVSGIVGAACLSRGTFFLLERNKLYVFPFRLLRMWFVSKHAKDWLKSVMNMQN